LPRVTVAAIITTAPTVGHRPGRKRRCANHVNTLIATNRRFHYTAISKASRQVAIHHAYSRHHCPAAHYWQPRIGAVLPVSQPRPARAHGQGADISRRALGRVIPAADGRLLFRLDRPLRTRSRGSKKMPPGEPGGGIFPASLTPTNTRSQTAAAIRRPRNASTTRRLRSRSDDQA
jgi:hypothetical protein